MAKEDIEFTEVHGEIIIFIYPEQKRKKQIYFKP